MADKAIHPLTNPAGEETTEDQHGLLFDRASLLEAVILLFAKAEQYQLSTEHAMESRCQNTCDRVPGIAAFGSLSAFESHEPKQAAWYDEERQDYEYQRKYERPQSEEAELGGRSVLEVTKELLRAALRALHDSLSVGDERREQVFRLYVGVRSEVNRHMENIDRRAPAWDAYVERLYELFPEAEEIFKSGQETARQGLGRMNPN